MSGVISGTGDVVVNNDGTNTGTLVLSGTNTYQGGTTIAAGRIDDRPGGTIEDGDPFLSG